MRTYPMLIDGRLVNSSERDHVIDPAHGAALAIHARASKPSGQAVAAWAYRTERATHRQVGNATR